MDMFVLAADKKEGAIMNKSKNESLLKELRKIIDESGIGNCSMPVRINLETDSIESSEPMFEIICEGKMYSNYLSYEAAKDTLQAIIKGMQIASHLTVHTTAGVLRAYKSTDPGQPGIAIMLQPAGYKEEVDMSYVSVYEDPEHRTRDEERPVDVAIYTYGNIYTEDETSKNIIRREDVIQALALD